MLLAEVSSGGFLLLLLFWGYGLYKLTASLEKLDHDGVVKDAAKKGVVSMISRWLK